MKILRTWIYLSVYEYVYVFYIFLLFLIEVKIGLVN